MSVKEGTRQADWSAVAVFLLGSATMALVVGGFIVGVVAVAQGMTPAWILVVSAASMVVLMAWVMRWVTTDAVAEWRIYRSAREADRG